MGLLDGLLGNVIGSMLGEAIELKAHSAPRAIKGSVETYCCKLRCRCCSKMAAWKECLANFVKAASRSTQTHG